jgi:hypothetical protein
MRGHDRERIQSPDFACRKPHRLRRGKPGAAECSTAARGHITDFVILDDGRSVGRIVKDASSPRWIWSVNTSPFPAPPPHNGLAPTLEEAKQQFNQRYLEMKAQGVRPFA